MQSTVAFVVAVLMIATPATQVLAQTPQQQDIPARRNIPHPPPVKIDATSAAMPAPQLPMTA